MLFFKNKVRLYVNYLPALADRFSKIGCKGTKKLGI